MVHWPLLGDITGVVKSYVPHVNKLNDGTRRTGTLRTHDRGLKHGGNVNRTLEIQDLIKDYGMISNWGTTTDSRNHLMKPGSYLIHTITVELLYPSSGPIPDGNREVRTELYLQAESIIEVLSKEFQIIHPPMIVLGGDDWQVRGTIEVEFETK
jgi:hypothetical protein